MPKVDENICMLRGSELVLVFQDRNREWLIARQHTDSLTWLQSFTVTVTCNNLFLIYGGHESFLWDHWYPCFRLLVMSPLGFKARVGSALFALGTGVHGTYSLRFLSGATPADLLAASMVAKPISSTYLRRHWWDLNGRPLTPWVNAQPTELSRCGDLNRPPIFRAPLDYFYCCEWDPFFNIDFFIK